MPTQKDDSKQAFQRGEKFGLTLCVATRGRTEFLARRLPKWSAAGFDEVVVADNSVDPDDRRTIRALCEQYRVTYLPIEPRLRDQRSRAWNEATARSKTSWILIQGDDDEIISSYDREVLKSAAVSADYLAPIKGTEVLRLERGTLPFLFRREFALRLGGYPEYLAGGEDHVLRRTFAAVGRVGFYDARRLWMSVELPADATKFIPHPISVVRNLFWYQMCLFFLMRVVEDPNRFIRGLGRDVSRFVLEAVRRPGGVLLALAGLYAVIAGLLASGFHLLKHRRELARIRSLIGPRA